VCTFGNDDNTAVGNMKALSVFFQVHADGGFGGDGDVFVNNGFANNGMSSDFDIFHEDGVRDFGIGVDAYFGGEDGAVDASA